MIAAEHRLPSRFTQLGSISIAIGLVRGQRLLELQQETLREIGIPTVVRQLRNKFSLTMDVMLTLRNVSFGLQQVLTRERAIHDCGP